MLSTIFETTERLIDGVNTGTFMTVTGKRRSLTPRHIEKYRREIEAREERRRKAEEDRRRLEASELYNDPTFKALRELNEKLASDQSALALAEWTLAELGSTEAQREADRSHADALFEAGEISEAEYATRVNAARAAKAEQEEAAATVRKLRYLIPIRTEQLKEAREKASERAAHYQAPAVRKVAKALKALQEAKAELEAVEQDIERSIGTHFVRMGSTKLVAGGADSWMIEAGRFIEPKGRTT